MGTSIEHMDDFVKLTEIFELGMQEQDMLEDGEEDEFSKRLSTFIDQNRDQAIDIITKTIEEDRVDRDLLSRALSIVGEIEDTYTHSERLRLLTESLFSPSRKIRYGAMTGLSILNDPSSTPDLKRVLEFEKDSVLQRVLKQVLEYLERHKNSIDIFILYKNS